MVMTQACASPQSTAPLSSSQGNYLAFGAAGALLKYIAGECGVALLSKSLDVRSAYRRLQHRGPGAGAAGGGGRLAPQRRHQPFQVRS